MKGDQARTRFKLFSTFVAITCVCSFVKLLADLAAFNGAVLDDSYTPSSDPPAVAVYIDDLVNFPVFTTLSYIQRFPIGQRYLWGSSYVVNFLWITAYLVTGAGWTMIIRGALRLVTRYRSQRLP